MEKPMKIINPKNLPKTNWTIDIGFEKSTSMVLFWISSVKFFMPIAGINNASSHGIKSKKGLKSPIPVERILYGFSTTQNNKLQTIKKTPITK